jgi:hypothetical protein
MFRRLIVALFFVLAIVLVACGGDEPEASPQPEGTSSPAEPTATAEPPTATPEPSPTPTETPTPTAVAEAGSGWGASGSGAQSACDHPYLPLRPGATWRYETSEGEFAWEVIEVQGDMDEASAVLGVTAGDISLEYHWQCVAGQGISSFDFAGLSSAPVGLDLTIEQAGVEGQFLLPPEQMVVGANWTAVLTGTVSFSQTIEGTTFEVAGDMQTVQDNTIVSADPVEFNGQNVPSLQIEQANTITLMLSLMGTATEQTFEVTNNYDLGYGIGMISQNSVTDFGTETMTLVEYSIP